MEEVLVLFIQLLVELLFNSMVSIPFDIFFSGYTPGTRATGCALTCLFMLIGAALGGLSLLVMPHLMITNPTLRIVNLVLSPILAGLLAMLVARFRGVQKEEWSHFWHSFWFTLLFASIRLAYCQR